MSTLTTNDSAVLQALFDAESSPSSTITIDPSLLPFPGNAHITPEIHDSLSVREHAIINSLQSQDVSRDSVQTAIEALTALITEYPGCPSPYVNRAQAFRLLGGDSMHDDDDEEKSAITERLLADLGSAITLCTPASPASPVSPAQARILADAHTHRGYILLQAARARSRANERYSVTGRSGPELEELASRDFFFGGRYGNKIAQQLAVQTNPYAKMCGAIVKEAMRKDVI